MTEGGVVGMRNSRGEWLSCGGFKGGLLVSAPKMTEFESFRIGK